MIRIQVVLCDNLLPNESRIGTTVFLEKLYGRRIEGDGIKIPGFFIIVLGFLVRRHQQSLVRCTRENGQVDGGRFTLGNHCRFQFRDTGKSGPRIALHAFLHIKPAEFTGLSFAVSSVNLSIVPALFSVCPTRQRSQTSPVVWWRTVPSALKW